MHYLRHILGAMLSATCLLPPVPAQQVFVYPNKGQSTQMTGQDKYEGNMLYQRKTDRIAVAFTGDDVTFMAFGACTVL